MRKMTRQVCVVLSLVLILLGLALAAQSDPRRFSLSPSADRQIDMLAGAGFVCTIAGIALLLTSTRSMRKDMIPEKKSAANIAVGAGFVLQLAGFFLLAGEESVRSVGLLMFLVSIPILVWGCMRYAEAKKYSKWVGLLGMGGIAGLVVLVVLPTKNKEMEGA